MTTRRRLIGAGIALGLLPSRALAQTAEPKTYQCQKNLGTGDKIHVNVIGKMNRPTSMTSAYTLQMKTKDIEIGQGMTSFGSGPKGTMEFIMEQRDPNVPGIEIQNIRVDLNGIEYDREITPYTPKSALANFIDKDGFELFSIPAKLERYSGENSTEAHLDIDMMAHYTNGSFEPTPAIRQRIADNFAEIEGQNGHVEIEFYDVERGKAYGDAIMVYHADGINFAQMKKLLAEHLAPEVEKLKAGQCAEQTVPCFLTTAASHTLDLADDCWELETLRQFRDGPLMEMEGGAALVERYYTEAPAIVRQLPLADNIRLWTRTWLTGVLPAAILCRLGWHKAALCVYRRMFERLSAA